MPKLLLVLCLAAGLHAESPALRLQWDELAGAVSGKHVSVSLKDGSSLKGIASGVAADSLVVVASGRKSEISIPHDRIAGLRLTKMRIRGRVISTVLGSLVGLVAGSVLIVHGSDSGFICEMVHAALASGIQYNALTTLTSVYRRGPVTVHRNN